MAARAIDLSRAELRALLLRAARGAGYPLGHCEDIALALGEFGDAAEISAAADDLSQGWPNPHSALSQAPLAIDALAAGVAMRSLKDIANPTLIAPFLCAAAQQQRCRVALEISGSNVTLRHGTPPPQTPTSRVKITPHVYNQLAALAARTYVPASDASRAGAGAGAIDND